MPHTHFELGVAGGHAGSAGACSESTCGLEVETGRGGRGRGACPEAKGSRMSVPTVTSVTGKAFVRPTQLDRQGPVTRSACATYGNGNWVHGPLSTTR